MKQPMMKQKLMLLAILLPVMGFSQTQNALSGSPPDSTKSKIFQLGEVTVAASKDDETTSRLNASDMEEQNKLEVSRALNMLPGIHLTASGPRNESLLTVRGFDLRQTPVYMDGIPVYVPYDGYVDLARFTTFDLSVIDVSKGFSSVLYGPNSLGGAINLISRKPVNKFEFDGALGAINLNGYRGNINLGSDLGKFYVQGGFSYLYRDSYVLSSDFDSTKNENGKQRDNSYRTDLKFNIKAGWTPNDRHEYVLGYIYQHGKKGTPVYCGEDSLNSLYTKPRYWQWPNWDKQTLYFLSNTALNGKNYIKTRFYYDIFKNSLYSFDDATYTTQNKPYAFQTWYDDYTYGGSAEFGTAVIPKNSLKLALHFKEDVHRENDLNEPVRQFNDYTLTIGAEDVYNVTANLEIIPGFSYSMRKNTRAEEYNSTDETIVDFPEAGLSHAFNGQLGIFYTVKEHHKLGALFSHKTRFATIKDRYSYRMGTALPNPDLKPEMADNFEVNYSGKYFKKLSVQTALFYSRITDVIMSISNVQPGKSQMQNAGKAAYMGAEAGVHYDILKNLVLGANYTYIKRKNLTNPDLRFTGVPDSKIFCYMKYLPIKQISLLASVEYNSSRYSASYGVQTEAFTLLNAVISGKIWKYLSLEAGVNNILGKDYSLVEGYPEEGRNYFVTLRFFNH